MKLRDHHYELDEIDRQLLSAVQEDAKAPLSRLGERVGLSAPSVMERMRKLEQAEIIQGYHAHLDGRALGLDVAAFIGVAVRDPQAIARVETWVETEPQVLECHHVTGGFTLLFKVKTRNTRSLEQLLSRIRGLDGVASTETMVVLSTHTERAQLPLLSDDDAPVGGGQQPHRRRRRAP